MARFNVLCVLLTTVIKKTACLPKKGKYTQTIKIYIIMKKLSDFQKELNKLYEKCFTKEFKNKELSLDLIFDNMNIDPKNIETYEDGSILNAIIFLNEKVKKEISKIVKDIDSYNRLVDLEFHSNKKENQTDLCSILEYSEKKNKQEIIYDKENELFFYRDDKDSI